MPPIGCPSGRAGARWLAVGLCAALLAAGCSSRIPGRPSGPTAANASPEPPITMPAAAPTTFSDCTSNIKSLIGDSPGSERDLGWECGGTQVPLDYRQPDGKKLDIAVIRVRFGGEHDRVGDLFVNPGGPGGSGTQLVISLALTLPMEILERFDLVGFDPRGVGLSSPVRCISNQAKDEITAAEPYARNAAEFQLQVDIADRLGQGCHDQYGEDLGHYDTLNTARDMDQLRASLGETAVTYLGYSYGTTLGSTYAELFPDHVRALVLDGAVDPTLDDKASTEAQARGFESAFDAFAADCLAGRSCPAGPDPRGSVMHLLDTARQAPIPTTDPGGRTVPVGLVFTGVLSALYSRSEWPTLSAGIGAAAGGDATDLLKLADQYTGRLADGSYDNRLDANLTINCADTAESFTDDEVRQFVESLRTKYPLFGAPVAANLLTCSHWQASRHPLPLRDAVGAPPIMVVGTTNDPATPYTGAQAMAAELDSGFLVTWQGEGHTAYPQTPCITSAVDHYLIDLQVPGDPTTCPAG